MGKSHSRMSPLTLGEQIYICKFYEYDGRNTMSYALGVPGGTISTKVNQLRQSGLFEIYKKMSDDEWEQILLAEESTSQTSQ